MKAFAPIATLFFVWPLTALSAQVGKKPVTIDDVVHEEKLVSPGVSRLEWSPGGNHLSFIRPLTVGKTATSTIQIYDVERKNERVLFDPTRYKEKVALATYQWSPRGDALLFQGDGDLWLYETQIGQLRRLTDDSGEEQEPTFSPAGDRVAFVKKNNLYVLNLKNSAVRQLTSDGSKLILNGILDWVYGEELSLHASTRSYKWSPDGKSIAFLRLDDTAVPEYPLTDFLAVHAQASFERFPQPGDPNPVPSFRVVAVEEGKEQTHTFPFDSAQAEYIAPSFSWTADAAEVCFLTLNRAQNELTVHLWNPVSGQDRVLLVEKDPYWINSLEPPYFLSDDNRCLWLSERDGWLQLYLYNREGQLLKQLTRGNWMIDGSLLRAAPAFQTDEKAGWVYFNSTEKDPRERHLCRVRLDGGNFQRLTREVGHHSLSLSPNGQFLVDVYSALDVPPETRLLASNGTFLTRLDKPENHLGEYALAKTEFEEVKAPDGATLYARLTKPEDFSPVKKYPVLVSVYAGPLAQLVQNAWGEIATDTLYTQMGFLVWSLDSRGSWGRGHAWETPIFKNLGQHELSDQLAGIAYLKSLPYVDPKRISVSGWSYGGYFTLYALTHAPEVFACGIAGAPVTDWKFYDSIYTERYMRTPQENPQGYRTSSPLEAAARLRARLLLIHGLSDDNVHIQNSITFINRLIDAQRPLELYLQPGQKHEFLGDAARTYVLERRLDFLQGCR
jgi:dipeptidyl-peptidase-4